MELKEWKERNAKARKYAHFDEKVSLDNVWTYISNSDNIKKHGFYPFIHYEKVFNKFEKDNSKGHIKEKTRDLCYSAHIDRYIYSYYSFLLNQKYNMYLKERNMDMVAVAYRDNLKMNNIHFARRAFDFIKDAQECFVIIGDFSHFFDNLDHRYLKKMLCSVLGVSYLSDDYYAVFKNITKYSVWELVDLLEINGLKDNEDDINKLNTKQKVLSKAELKKYKSKYIKKHIDDYGIPQGSPISAVLANIYMLEADEKIFQLVCKYSGLYMRYSDDFIIVLPQISDECFETILKDTLTIVNSIPNLILQSEKTQIFRYQSPMLTSCSSLYLEGGSNGKNEIDYLGFSFDGERITISFLYNSKCRRQISQT